MLGAEWKERETKERESARKQVRFVCEDGGRVGGDNGGETETEEWGKEGDRRIRT